MLRFSFKLTFLVAKLALRVFAVLGGIVFASLGNAALSFLRSDSDGEESRPSKMIQTASDYHQAISEGDNDADFSYYLLSEVMNDD